jgi:hypothetical protein
MLTKALQQLTEPTDVYLQTAAERGLAEPPGGLWEQQGRGPRNLVLWSADEQPVEFQGLDDLLLHQVREFFTGNPRWMISPTRKPKVSP